MVGVEIRKKQDMKGKKKSGGGGGKMVLSSPGEGRWADV